MPKRFHPIGRTSKVKTFFGILAIATLLASGLLKLYSSNAQSEPWFWMPIAFGNLAIFALLKGLVPRFSSWLEESPGRNSTYFFIASGPLILFILVLGLGSFLNEKLDQSSERLEKICTFKSIHNPTGRRSYKGSYVNFEDCEQVAVAEFELNLQPGTKLGVFRKNGFFGISWVSRVGRETE